jgi:hypothetical protein
MTTKHTPGTLRARHSYCGPDTDDPQMMRFACSIDCDAPFVNNIPESDHYGERFEEQALARVYGRTAEEMRANAARLALCWNSHDALVVALRDTLDLAEEALAWREQSEDPEDAEVLDLPRERVEKARCALAVPLANAGCGPKRAEAVVNAMRQHETQIVATYATRLQLASLQKQLEQRFANQAEVRKLQLGGLRKEITLRAGALIAGAVGLLATILGLHK